VGRVFVTRVRDEAQQVPELVLHHEALDLIPSDGEEPPSAYRVRRNHRKRFLREGLSPFARLPRSSCAPRHEEHVDRLGFRRQDLDSLPPRERVDLLLGEDSALGDRHTRGELPDLRVESQAHAPGRFGVALEKHPDALEGVGRRRTSLDPTDFDHELRRTQEARRLAERAAIGGKGESRCGKDAARRQSERQDGGESAPQVRAGPSL